MCYIRLLIEYLKYNMSESEDKDAQVDQGAGTSRDSRQMVQLSREIEELHNQSRILSREILTVQDAHKNIICVLIRCQGLLYELSKEQVRYDFLHGKIDGLTDCSDEMLLSLDELRTVMLLSPRAERNGLICGDEAVSFASRLFSKDAGEPMVQGAFLPIRQYFGEWRTVFQRLLSSSYWATRKVQVAERKTVPDSDRGSEVSGCW